MADLDNDIVKKIYKGDHRTFKLIVKDQDDNVFGYPGGSLIFTVREDYESAVVIEKTSAVLTEIELTDPVNGESHIYLNPEDTKDLEAGSYVFDIELTTAGAKRYTVVRGVFIVEEDVTKH